MKGKLFVEVVNIILGEVSGFLLVWIFMGYLYFYILFIGFF